MYIICVKLNSQQTCISLNARVYNCIFRRDQSLFQMYLKTFNIHKVSIKIKEQIFVLAFSTMITMKMLKKYVRSAALQALPKKNDQNRKNITKQILSSEIFKNV